MALEDPGTTGPDGPAFHQRGGMAVEAQHCRRSVRRGYSFSVPDERGKETARRILPAGRQVVVRRLRRLPNVGSLKPLGPLRHFELDLVALGQALEALGLDRAEVDEDIAAAVVGAR